MFYLKTAIFVLLSTYFLSSCSFSQVSSNGIVKNDETVRQQPTATVEQNNNNNVEINLNTVSHHNDSANMKYSSPHQTKPRRKKIEFPEDCQIKVRRKLGKDTIRKNT